jgi:hypothetical protein
MTKYQQLRQNLKELAEAIRKAKSDHKQCQRDHGCDGYWEGEPGKSKWISRGFPFKLKHEFRHKHIAYCLLRGRTRDEIEHPADDNKPDENLIREIYDAYTEENVCVGA